MSPPRLGLSVRKHLHGSPLLTKGPRMQYGVTLLETLIALLPVILIASLCIELARAYQIRQLLTLSLQETARVAAVHQGAPQSWQPALRDALSKLFVPPGRFATPQARRDAAAQTFQKEFGLPLWQASRLASSPETIHLRLTYLYNPMQDWLRVMLKALSSTHSNLGRVRDNDGELEKRAWALGLIPIVIEYRVLNQRGLGPS